MKRLQYNEGLDFYYAGEFKFRDVDPKYKKY